MYRILFILAFVIVFTACRDTKKDEAATEEIEVVEATEEATEILDKEIESASEEVNKEVEELEEAVEALDSI